MTLILGRKRGMTQLFTDDGDVVGVTVVGAGPCVVCQVRTEERDGYDAVQLGFEEKREKLVSKPQRGHFAAAKTAPLRFLKEERLDGPAEQAVGDTIDVTAFEEGQLVDVIGTTKGKGFAGTIKRHGFARGPMTHGSMNRRRPGSIGASAYPARVFRGKRMGGHMGARQHTVKNLRIVKIDAEQGLLFVAGAIPGPNDGLVQIRTAKTGTKTKKAK